MRIAKTILFLSISLLICCKSNQLGTDAISMSFAWNEIKSADQSTPIARHEAAFIKVQDKMYLLGGRDIRPVSIYNPTTNTWTSGKKPPIELHHFQPVVYNNEILIAGAMTGPYPGETPVPNIYIYNPQNDSWRKGPEIPENRRRGGAGAVIEGDLLYIVCGIKDGHRGDHKKWLDTYNFTTKTWETLPDAPRARDHFNASIVNGKLYALGGRTTIAADNPFKNTIKEGDVYSITTRSWSTLPEGIPTLRAGSFNLVNGNEILVIGGESFTQEKAHSEVEALQTTDEKWKIYPPLPVGRHGTGAISYEGNIVIASGCGNRGGNPELSDLWVFK